MNCLHRFRPGRVVEEDLDPACRRSFISTATSTLPADYRDSEFHGEMLWRLLAILVADVLFGVTAFWVAHLHSGGAQAAHIQRSIGRRLEHPLATLVNLRSP